MTENTFPLIESASSLIPGVPLLPVTVVGSYPCTLSNDLLLRGYYSKTDPYLETIARCIQEQIEAGVEILSDGQTRGSMVDIFASRLAGIRMKGKPVVFSEIRHSGSITEKDQKIALSSMNNSGVVLKGIITGPHTMSHSVTDTYYNDKEELAFAFAHALNQEARVLQKTVPMIQFDEPFFSVQFPEYARDMISVLLDGIEIPVTLHACGDVSEIFPELIEMPFDILDHEFASNPDLFDNVKEYDFRQMVGFGVVRSDSMNIETIDVIAGRIRQAVEHFGAKRLMVDPDCGLKHLTPEVAFAKLRNIRAARDEVLMEVG